MSNNSGQLRSHAKYQDKTFDTAKIVNFLSLFSTYQEGTVRYTALLERSALPISRLANG